MRPTLRPMSRLFRNLLVILAVLSVGTLQVFGISKGYLCACTGEETVKSECETVVCHPAVVHADGCGGDHDRDGGHSNHDSEPPTQDGHKHSEVRESLETTGATSVVQLPAVVYFILSPAFRLPDVNSVNLTDAGPALPPDGSPPTPLLVARTMVMLV